MPQLGKSITGADAFPLLIGDKLEPYQIVEYNQRLERRAKEPGFALVPALMGKSAPGMPFLSLIHWIEARTPHTEPTLSRIIVFVMEAGVETCPGRQWPGQQQVERKS